MLPPWPVLSLVAMSILFGMAVADGETWTIIAPMAGVLLSTFALAEAWRQR